MKASFLKTALLLASVPMTLGQVPSSWGQGTITFDAHNNWGGTHYVEAGMAFDLILPRGGTPDWMAIGFGADNTPRNGTPFMVWFRQHNPYDYVSLSLENGSGFGLTSVQLADPRAPSLSAVSISFIGYLAGGASVTNTFTTPGNGAATFVTYNFDSNFKAGLTSVDIFAPRWAMDNLVFAVPEPGSLGLTAVGMLMLLAWRKRSSGPGNRDPEPGS